MVTLALSCKTVEDCRKIFCKSGAWTTAAVKACGWVCKAPSLTRHASRCLSAQVVRAAAVQSLPGAGQRSRAGHVRTSTHLPCRLLRLRRLWASSHHRSTLRHAPQRHLLPGLLTASLSVSASPTAGGDKDSGTSSIGFIDSPLSSSITPSLSHSRLKPSFSANPSHCSLSFLLRDWLHGFPKLLTDTSEHIRFLLFSSSFFPLFSCWFRAVD